MQRQVRYRYRSERVQETGLNEQADIELISVEIILKKNDGIKFLIIVIDIFSYFFVVQPFLNKKITDSIQRNKIFFFLKLEILKNVRSDKGAEFTYKEFEEYENKWCLLFDDTESIKS